MELTSDIQDAITGSAPAPAEKREEAKRLSRRFPLGCRAPLFLIRDGAELAEHVVLLRETSASEFTFYDDEPRTVGDSFAIWFSGSKNRRVKMRCVVSRSDSTTDVGTEFIIGARFEQLLETSGEWENPQVHQAPAVVPDLAGDARAASRLFSGAQKSAEIKDARTSPSPTDLANASSTETRNHAAGANSTMQEKQSPHDSLSERPASSAQASAAGGKNQQILSKVLAKLAEQEHALRRLEEERNDAVRDCELLRGELTTVSQSLKTLQAKCDADDAAIAELAKLMDTESPSPVSSDRAAA